MLLDGRVALLTGASGGIGRATAERLADAGAALVLAGRDVATLRALARKTGGRAVVADLSEPGECARLADEVGPVDVAVLNAGVGWYGETAQMPVADVERLVAVNVLAPLRLCRLLLPGMIARQGGHVLFVASIAAHFCVGHEAVYSATKAAVAAFADALRAEVGGAGVGVSLVSPGAVQTEFFRRRGVPYQRDWPAAVPPSRVARAVVRAIEQNRPEVFVPAWLRFPATLRGYWPGVYRRLASHVG